MKTTPAYEYIDGSGNRYLITGTTIQYDPIKPEESSTGFYSGGEPAEAALTKAQYDQLREMLDDAINHTEIHTDARVKMSAIIVRSFSHENKQVILAPRSPEITSIESRLKEFLKK